MPSQTLTAQKTIGAKELKRPKKFRKSGAKRSEKGNPRIKNLNTKLGLIGWSLAIVSRNIDIELVVGGVYLQMT